MFLLFGSFAAGMIVSLLTIYLSFQYVDMEEDSPRDKILIIVRAGVFLVIPLLANYLPTLRTTPTVVAMILGILVVALMIYMIYWWNKEGSSVKELIATCVIELFLALVGNTALARVYDLKWPGGLIGFVMSVPMVLMIISIGYCVANMLWWHTIEKIRMKKEGTVGTTTPVLDAIRRKFGVRENEEGGEEDEEFDEFEQSV